MKTLFKKINNTEEKVFIGIYDFSYAPYALGDAITWQMNLSVKAIENNCAKIVQYIVADPLGLVFTLSALKPKSCS